MNRIYNFGVGEMYIIGFGWMKMSEYNWLKHGKSETLQYSPKYIEVESGIQGNEDMYKGKANDIRMDKKRGYGAYHVDFKTFREGKGFKMVTDQNIYKGLWHGKKTDIKKYFEKIVPEGYEMIIKKF